MLFYGDQKNTELSRSLAKVLSTRALFPHIHTFPDSEKRVILTGKISGETVVILKSFLPNVDTSLLELCLIIDAAKQSGAQEVIVVAPYLPYQRAERIFGPGEGVPLSAIAKIVESSGVDTLITVDPHIQNLSDFFSISLKIADPTDMFSQHLTQLIKKHTMISLVSPDEGGEQKVRELHKNNSSIETVILSKKRDHTTGAVQIINHTGVIQEMCVIVDDMITTGNTINESVQYLQSNGARKIVVMATHPVFSDTASHVLQSSLIEKVIVTDSIQIPENKKFNKLHVLSIAQLCGREILRS